MFIANTRYRKIRIDLSFLGGRPRASLVRFLYQHRGYYRAEADDLQHRPRSMGVLPLIPQVREVGWQDLGRPDHHLVVDGEDEGPPCYLGQDHAGGTQEHEVEHRALLLAR